MYDRKKYNECQWFPPRSTIEPGGDGNCKCNQRNASSNTIQRWNRKN